MVGKRKQARTDRARDLSNQTRLRYHADSYSAFVSLMKYGLPIGALLLVGLVFVLPRFGEAEKVATESIKSQIKKQDLENLYMVKVRYSGTDKKDRPYTLLADTARQVSTESELVALEAPKAYMELKPGQDGAWVDIRANAGAFYRKRRVLVLFGKVNIYHFQKDKKDAEGKGHAVQAEELEINLKTSTARSDKPISANGPLGSLQARGFEVKDRGKTMIFKGKARLTMYIKDERLRLKDVTGGLTVPQSASNPKPEAKPKTGASE